MSHKYLEHIREKNKLKASICHICKKQSTGINPYGYEIKFVCDEHFEAGTEVSIDTSIPGVIHYTYPNGKNISKDMLDPSIGGYFGNKPKK